MPRFFFDIYDDGEVTLDQFGVELKGLEKARRQADAVLPEIAREERTSSKRRVLRAVVRSPEGHCLYQTTLTIRSGWLHRPKPSDGHPVHHRP